MSAYIVSEETISVIVDGIIKYGISTPSVPFTSLQLMLVNERYQPIGQWLLDQNYASINARYREDRKAPTFEYKEVEDVNVGTLVGCIECYRYQACETDDWTENPVKWALDNLMDAIVHILIESKGFEIPWGI